MFEPFNDVLDGVGVDDVVAPDQVRHQNHLTLAVGQVFGELVRDLIGKGIQGVARGGPQTGLQMPFHEQGQGQPQHDARPAHDRREARTHASKR